MKQHEGTLFVSKRPAKLVFFIGKYKKKKAYHNAKQALEKITNWWPKKGNLYYISPFKINIDGNTCPYIDIEMPGITDHPAVTHVLDTQKPAFSNFFSNIGIFNNNRYCGHFNYWDNYISLRFFKLYREPKILRRKPLCTVHYRYKKEHKEILLSLQRFFGMQYWHITNLVNTFLTPDIETFDCELEFM